MDVAESGTDIKAELFYVPPNLPPELQTETDLALTGRVSVSRPHKDTPGKCDHCSRQELEQAELSPLPIRLSRKLTPSWPGWQRKGGPGACPCSLQRLRGSPGSAKLHKGSAEGGSRPKQDAPGPQQLVLGSARALSAAPQAGGTLRQAAPHC